MDLFGLRMSSKFGGLYGPDDVGSIDVKRWFVLAPSWPPGRVVEAGKRDEINER